jgi:hypothetical protein
MAAKRPRTGCAPEDLAEGSLVFYDSSGKRGVITEAFGPLDQFWVKDESSNQMVRLPNNDVKAFKAAELSLAEDAETSAPAAPGKDVELGNKPGARVLILGTESQMLQIIEHFGPPDRAVRREPQMLLALPCSAMAGYEKGTMHGCDAPSCPLHQQAVAGLEDTGLMSLAHDLRPDMGSKLGIRLYHLKQAIEQLGPDLAKLESYYCLSEVTMPYGWQAIEACDGERRRIMKEVRCHVDLGVTACGESLDDEKSLDQTARRVLGESCGIRLGGPVWEEEVQYRMRRLLSADIPLKYFDGPRVKGYVLILPSDLTAVSEGGLLTFREPRPGDSQMIGGKSVSQWKTDQSEFANLPPLPLGWIRVRSRGSGSVYFWNTNTHTPSNTFPLPPGWKQCVSKSSGKIYYFHAGRRESSYDVPTV